MVAGSRANTVLESSHKNHMIAFQRWEELRHASATPRHSGSVDGMPASGSAAMEGCGGAWRGAEGSSLLDLVS